MESHPSVSESWLLILTILICYHISCDVTLFEFEFYDPCSENMISDDIHLMY